MQFCLITSETKKRNDDTAGRGFMRKGSCLSCLQTVESRISLRIRAHWSESFRRTQTETRGYEKFMLNSAEYEILPAYKC